MGPKLLVREESGSRHSWTFNRIAPFIDILWGARFAIPRSPDLGASIRSPMPSFDNSCMAPRHPFRNHHPWGQSILFLSVSQYPGSTDRRTAPRSPRRLASSSASLGRTVEFKRTYARTSLSTIRSQRFTISGVHNVKCLGNIRIRHQYHRSSKVLLQSKLGMGIPIPLVSLSLRSVGILY